MASGERQKLVISGATGWLGREVLALMDSNRFYDRSYDLIPISSAAKTIELRSGRNLLTKTFDDLALPEHVAGFISLAFLTREKVFGLGHEEYVLRNLKLISNACQTIERSNPGWIVLVSSGAIFKSGSNQLETDISKNPYGFLKRIEELMIADAASRVGANIVIGRLWGATGRHMPINRAYAVSDFLCQAMEGGPIRINSRHRVFRRFCDAGEFMDVLISLAQKGENLTFDSGGPLIEIGALAAEIASHFPGVEIQRETPDSTPNDRYYPETETFESLAEIAGIGLSSISEQIDRTVVGHKAQFGI